MWDYVGDGYVHRLVQEMADGKLVEVPDPGDTWHGRQGGGIGAGAGWSDEQNCKADKDKEEAMLTSKLDAITAEYNHLLVS